MFKLCCNTSTLPNYNIFKALKFIKDSGYDAVEIDLNDRSIHPFHKNMAKLHQIRRFCDDIGLEIACISNVETKNLSNRPYKSSVICSCPYGRSKSLDSYKGCIELAQILGSNTLSINSGTLEENIEEEQAHEYFSYAMESLLKECGDTVLAIEQKPGLFIGTIDKAINYIKNFNTPNLGINLDIGPAFSQETEEYYEKISSSMTYSKHIHVGSMKKRESQKEIIAEGEISFRKIMDILEDGNYGNYISINLQNMDQEWKRALKVSRDFIFSHSATLSYA